jgi:hypothetical protein
VPELCQTVALDRTSFDSLALDVIDPTLERDSEDNEHSNRAFKDTIHGGIM